jgi:hypothetical protein
MKTWRPEGWDNPYSEDKKLTKPWTEWFQSDAEIACEAGADLLLKAIREVIEKLENPYCPFPGSFEDEHEGFERCRQKILALLKGGGGLEWENF